MKVLPHNSVSETTFKHILKENNFSCTNRLIDTCSICHSIVEDKRPKAIAAVKNHNELVVKIGVGLQIIEKHLPKGIYLRSYYIFIFIYVGFVKVTFDFKSKESLPKGPIQHGSSYYHHVDIPVLIFVVLYFVLK
jgi:hypothetical protein